MKSAFTAFLFTALLGFVGQQAQAAVVVSNLDPANYGNSLYQGTELGESVLISNRPISLTSVMFPQTTGQAAGESFAVYSRNADGSLGTSLFSGFTVGFDSTAQISTATVTSAFTLQANTGYWFVLNTTASFENWDNTQTADYAAAFGATLPATRTAFLGSPGSVGYTNLGGPLGTLVIQVNGTALAAVPEPSALAFIGLALAGGVVIMARRRLAAA